MNWTMKYSALLPAGALALGLATSASAQDVYNGCSKNTTNKMRPSSVLVNATPLCKDTETPRTWNQEGPQGTPGFSSCSVEEVSGSCNANTFAVLNAFCSGDAKATGASAIWHTPFDAADNGPFYILPRNQNEWTIVPYNHTGVQQDFRAFLQCCS